MHGAIGHATGAASTSGGMRDGLRPSRRGGYVGQLKRELGIAADQGTAWESFAASLEANAQRMDAVADAACEPVDAFDLAFGSAQDRLAALAAMQLTAADLLAALTPMQRHRAGRLLPLCCLPEFGRG